MSTADRAEVSWTTAVRTVAAREFAQYFDSKIAYVFTIAFVVLANSIFMNEFFLSGIVYMTRFFELLERGFPLLKRKD